MIPPTLLFHAGKPVRSTFNLLLDDTHFGPIIVPDIQTINTSLGLGESLLAETVAKYGFDAYLGGIRSPVDGRSGERCAQHSRRCPMACTKPRSGSTATACVRIRRPRAWRAPRGAGGQSST